MAGAASFGDWVQVAESAQIYEAELIALFAWKAEEFAKRMEGSAIRRIGYERWSRNLAIGLGNADYDEGVVAALVRRPSMHTFLSLWVTSRIDLRNGTVFDLVARRNSLVSV